MQFGIYTLAASMLVCLLSSSSNAEGSVDLAEAKESYHDLTKHLVSQFVSAGIEQNGWTIENREQFVERFSKELASCTVDALAEAEHRDAQLLLVLLARRATESEISSFLEDPIIDGREELLNYYVDQYKDCFERLTIENGLRNE